MFVIYIYMNSTTPKRHAETPRNWNIPFQLKKQNTYRNRIDNLALIRCDGTISKIILSYWYKITSIPLLCCMKQVKSGNIKESINIQEGVRKPYTLRQNTFSASSFLILHLPSSLLYLHKNSLILPLMSLAT
jgi:hypothetical protein